MSEAKKQFADEAVFNAKAVADHLRRILHLAKFGDEEFAISDIRGAIANNAEDALVILDARRDRAATTAATLAERLAHALYEEDCIRVGGLERAQELLRLPLTDALNKVKEATK